MDKVYLKQAAKFLETCDLKLGKRIVTAIDKIPTGNIKPLNGKKINAYRLRIGKVRVIFVVENETVVITKIDYRGDVYK